MADIVTMGKARAYGILLQQLFGEDPSYYSAADHVKVYYEPDKLLRVQQRVNAMATGGPADVRIDWLPMITPLAIKKAAPYVLGIAALGFLLGKAT